MLDKFPLSNRLLQDLGCLKPLCRDDPTGIVAIRRVAEKLKCVLPSTLTNLEDEWRVYQLDSDEVPKLIEEYSAAMVKPQSLKELDREDSDDDMGPESHSAESYISAVAPVFFWSLCAGQTENVCVMHHIDLTPLTERYRLALGTANDLLS